MSKNKPLSYECSKTVLQYLEVNLRFQISSHCPSLRKTERLIPLHIDNLSFSTYALDARTMMSINKMDYYFGTYRQYPKDDVTPHPIHLEENDRGGVPTDLDQFGFEDYSSNKILNPGDVVVHTLLEKELYRPEEVNQREQLLEVYKKILDQKMNGKVEDNTYLAKNYYDKKEVRRLQDPNYSIKDLQRHIDSSHAILLPYLQKRENIKVNYSTLAFLTMESNIDSDKKHVEKFNGKIHEAEKAMYKFLFENCKILVKNLYLGRFFTILRFPADLKLRVRNLRTNESIFRIGKSLPKFIDDTSFPLESLEISKINSDDLKDPYLIGAQKLRIQEVTLACVVDFSKLKNLKVDVEFAALTCIEFNFLIQKWIDSDEDKRKEIGTCYTFGVKHKNAFEANMALKGMPSGAKSIRVPINGTSELVLSYEDVNSEYIGKAKWIFKMEVVAI